MYTPLPRRISGERRLLLFLFRNLLRVPAENTSSQSILSTLSFLLVLRIRRSRVVNPAANPNSNLFAPQPPHRGLILSSVVAISIALTQKRSKRAVNKDGVEKKRGRERNKNLRACRD